MIRYSKPFKIRNKKKQIGGSITEKKLKEIFVKLDTNNDNQVNKRELIKGVRKDPDIAEIFNLSKKGIRQEDGTRDKFEEVFQSIDTNEDREISWDELKEHFSSVLNNTSSSSSSSSSMSLVKSDKEKSPGSTNSKNTNTSPKMQNTDKKKDAKKKLQQMIDMLNSAALDIEKGIPPLKQDNKSNNNKSNNNKPSTDSNVDLNKYSLLLADKELRELVLQMVTVYVTYIKKQDDRYEKKQQDENNKMTSNSFGSTDITQRKLEELREIRAKLGMKTTEKQIHNTSPVNSYNMGRRMGRFNSSNNMYRGGKKNFTLPFRTRGGRKNRKRQYTRIKNNLKFKKNKKNNKNNKKGTTRRIKNRKYRKFTRKLRYKLKLRQNKHKKRKLVRKQDRRYKKKVL